MAPAAALANLGSVAAKLHEFAEAGDHMQALTSQLTDVLGEVERARSAFAGLLEETVDAKYETERQRFVTIRLVGTFNPADTTTLLALEEQYRAEYDAIRALQALIQFVQK